MGDALERKAVTREVHDAAYEQRVQKNLFQLDPTVIITLKGKPYTLEINNYAVKGVLVDTKVNLLSTGFRVGEMTDPTVSGSMLYWGLKTYHPELTQEDVDKLYTYRHYAYILNRLKEAIELFLPDMSDMQIEEVREETADKKDPQ